MNWVAFIAAAIMFGIMFGVLVLIHLALIINILVLKILAGFLGIIIFVGMFAILYRVTDDTMKGDE